MNKKVPAYALQRVAVLLFAVMLLFCAVVAPQADAADFKASYIKELDKSQLNVNTESYFDSDVIYKLPAGVSENDEISVIITLSAKNLMDAYEETDKSVSFADFLLSSEEVDKVQNEIWKEQRDVLETLDQKAVTYRVGEGYNTLFAGFELLIRAGDVNVAKKALGKNASLMIGEEYAPAETELVNNKIDVYETGIFKGEGSGYDGTGTVVAVLDTGVDYAHSAFSVKNFHNDPSKLGLTFDQVAALIGNTTASTLSPGLSASDVFINNKIPFAFDYADSDPDPYSDQNNHGTHVSGIICGKDDTITGVAPNAQLVSMKVFSSVYGSAKTSWILTALEDCVKLGVDVINMSLGTTAGFRTSASEEEYVDWENEVYGKIRDTGISLIVAASNDGTSAQGSAANGNLGLTSNPDIGTVGSPGTYPTALSVASINGVKTPYLLYNDTIIYFNETNTGAAEENSFFDTILGDAESKEVEFVLIPGVGRTADYLGLDVNGKIALVRRGDNTFEEKAMIAEKAGAAGILVYNNVSGDIRMNVGDAKLASCSISQDVGEMLAEIGGGVLKIAKNQRSGPFISDFSSWGTTPDLQIKPEITAHGGNILSAVTGGSYDQLSGTSMACPNVAGVALLLRQYVVENFPNIKDDSVAVNTMVNRLMMSSADILRGKNGLPYAVRRQGAGLANLTNAISTKALIKTFDVDGNEMDKTKLELGHDPQKTGVYEMSFAVENFGSGALSYDIGAIVMTEGVSETLTNAGQTTITEQGYILEGAKLEILKVEGGSQNGMNLTVDGGKTASVTVKITLSDADKKYMDDSFANGMYVEGFITLTATAGTEVDLNVPYLAFYGDWGQAPLFDRDYFETDQYEQDDLIAPEDKILPDAYSTRPVGSVQGDYINYLGSYYFVQDPSDRQIYANRDHISMSNQEGTVHGLYGIWAGMLRNAERVEIKITDNATGEVIYQDVDTFIRKSYGGGGTIRPAMIETDFDLMDYNLPNNSEYTVELVGYLDYEDGCKDQNKNNTFTFPLTVDIQAPVVEDVEYYFEYDKTLKKNRLYAKVAVYDNHHTMAMQLAYAYSDQNGSIGLKGFEQYLTPVYSEKNSTTYVTYELTDYIYELKAAQVAASSSKNDHSNSIVLVCYDYALNTAYYEVGLPDNFVDFYMESLALDGNVLELSPNEIYTIAPAVYPDTEWSELLEYDYQKNGVVKVVNNKLVALKPGNATVIVRDPQSGKDVSFKVKVLAEGEEGYKKISRTVADNFVLTGYETKKAYYQLASQDRNIGVTGDIRFFEGNTSLTMYPSESVLLNYTVEEYFPIKAVYETGNEAVATVDEYGRITAVGEGFTSVTVTMYYEDKPTTISQSVTIEVLDPYINNGAYLMNYFGNGGVVTIPEDKHFTHIYQFAFSNYDYQEKTPEELEFDDSTTSIARPIGDDTITKVIIPEGVERIENYAFALLTALEEVSLPSTLTEIDYYAFYGCINLKKITFPNGNNLKIINKSAFENCNITGELDLASAYVVGANAFAGNKNLTSIKLPETLQSIGAYAFAGCEKLDNVEVAAEHVKYGVYAFTGCKSLRTFPELKTYLIPTGMFYQCEKLAEVTIGAEVNNINEYAFRDTNVDNFVINKANDAFKTQDGDVIISADGKTLVAVAPSVKGSFEGEASITTVGRGAFSHTNSVSSVKLPNVTVVEDYAFAGDEEDKRLKEVELGTLTYIGDYAFSACGITEVPEFTADAKLGKYAFMMSNVRSVSIPDGMTLPEGIFSRCPYLATVTIGNNVTVGDFAFYQNVEDCEEFVKRNVNGQVVYTVTFDAPMTSLTIGDNAVLGESAFNGCFDLKTVTLGAGAIIGKQAFYNCESLKNIDLSKVVSIGEFAFSGDIYNMFQDSTGYNPAYTAQGYYLFSYHAPALESVTLTELTSMGDYAFAATRYLKEVVLGEKLTEIPTYAFTQTPELKSINLGNIVIVGDQAFTQSGIVKVDLSSANYVGKYAFAACTGLNEVILNPAGTELGESAFNSCPELTTVGNMEAVLVIGDYAFAYTGITEAKLLAATSLGEAAFLKDKSDVPFRVTLSNNLIYVGDNPFAGSQIEPFYITESESFNGQTFTKPVYSFDYSETVKVIDGSLYRKVANGGLVLVTYTGLNPEDVKVADGTVRIGSMAFAYSNVKMVTLPYTVTNIGHKAMYGCEDLSIVVFTSHKAPILEEQFDSAYYDSLENLPGIGNYGEYENYDGTMISIDGQGFIPYFMWNSAGGQYSNVFYGANFVDYVGRVDKKILMVRPSNGVRYGTYMHDFYFDLVVNGTAAMDANTLAFIEAVNKLPTKITLECEADVLKAREAYGKLTSAEQQGLVPSYLATLQRAEQRIKALKDESAPTPPPVDPVVDPEPTNVGTIIAIVVVVVLVAAAAAVAVYFLLKKRNTAKEEVIPASEEAEEFAEETVEESEENIEEETTNE